MTALRALIPQRINAAEQVERALVELRATVKALESLVKQTEGLAYPAGLDRSELQSRIGYRTGASEYMAFEPGALVKHEREHLGALLKRFEAEKESGS